MALENLSKMVGNPKAVTFMAANPSGDTLCTASIHLKKIPTLTSHFASPEQVRKSRKVVERVERVSVPS